MPSSRSQTAATCSRTAGSGGGPTAAAHSRKRATVSDSAPPAPDSGGTGDPLERHDETYPARRQRPHRWAGCQQPAQEGPHAVAHLLAVVQHQQRPTVRQGGQDRIVAGVSGLLGHAHGCRDRRRHPLRVGDRNEVDEPHPVGEVTGRLRRHGQGGPGLAHLARTDHGDLPVQLQRLGRLPALPHPHPHPPDGRRQRRRECGFGARPLGAGTPGRLPGERRAVRQPHLAQQRGDVRLDRADGGVQPLGDLRVAEVLPSRASTSFSRAEIPGVDTRSLSLVRRAVQEGRVSPRRAGRRRRARRRRR